ncbi:nucleotide-diphospho-sugar transferase [Gongronella butleri]|nr:nucleotide-diphospho-sugar transferase [Gongronella butleri]
MYQQQQQQESSKIPKIVHFVYGLKGPDPQLDLIHYLAIKSAHDIHRPDKILFHYHYLPSGDMFERAKPYLELHQVDLIPTVFDRPLQHFAHQADVIRLNVLNKYGGIYLDLDVISLKPFDSLLSNEFVMGQEGVDGSVGLCNAVILSRPGARFLQRWIQTYRTFNMKDWNYHSVILPGKLAPYFKNEVTVLNHTSFFWPLWDGQGLRTLFLEKSYTFEHNFATHVWESAANTNLMKGLTEDVIMNVDNSLNCQLRRFLVDDPSKWKKVQCHTVPHTTRDDGIVGKWSLARTIDEEMDPMPATDSTGNEMHGVIRGGYYDKQGKDDGVYMNGKDSYVFLGMPTRMMLPTPGSLHAQRGVTVQWDMKTHSKDSGRAAMMLQTDRCKVIIKTRTIPGRGLALGVETQVLADNGWSWHRHKDLSVGAAPFIINQEDQYHRFTLVLQPDVKKDLLAPNLALYMDGDVIASHANWELPTALSLGSEDSLIIRGIWFGSVEPDRYQDTWDTSLSFAAWYKQVSVWERAMDIRDIEPRTFKNADN